MVKKLNFIFFLLAGLAISWPCSLHAQNGKQPNTFVLDGIIKGQPSGKIYLSRFDMALRKPFKDSAIIKNGRFHFEGNITEPTEFQIGLLTDPNRDFTNNNTSIFIEAGKMNIFLQKNHFDEAVISGSLSQKEMDALNKEKAAVRKVLMPLSKEYNRKNLEYIAAMRRTKDEDSLQYYKDITGAARDAMEPYGEELDKIDATFIKQHPASYVTASLMRWKTSSMTVAEIAAIYNKMPVAVQQSSYGLNIKDELEKLKKGSPGAKAFQFLTTDINNNILRLSDFKGKYVLIDFWASWCVPCRKSNPHLISLFNSYHHQGLEIIGISDDDSKPEAWKKAVDKDGIGIWHHVLRGLKRVGNDYDKSNDISNHYGIHTLPTKILIDPQGMIVGRYGGGGENDEAMDKKMKEIFETK